jgi:hypothetical protein
MKLADWAGNVFTVVALAAVPVAAARIGAPGPRDATLKLGPNSGGYLTGFAAYEIEGLLASRWSSYQAQVALPLEVRGGPLEVSYRFARVLPQTAVVDVALAGRPIDRFECRGGVWAVRRATLAAVPPTRATLAFAIDSHDRRNLGLRLDWVRLRVGPGGRLAVYGLAAWLPGLLAAWLFVLFRWSGHEMARAALLSAPWSAAAAVWAWLDPFALAHVALRIGVCAAVLVAMAAVVLRKVEGGRWALVIFAAALLIKGAGLFHPTSFYPDVANARRYILALAEEPGGLAERNRLAQVTTNVGYPRYVGGRAYAFPYSPLFFVPFGALSDPDRIEDAFRLAGLVLVSLEVLAVFALARLAVPGRARAALLAALLAAVLPIYFSRLLLAMTVTLAGNLLDTALVAAALALVRRPESRLRLALVGLLALASVSMYVSSLFTVSAFLVLVSLVERRLALRLLSVLALAAGLAVAWLYAPFVAVFVRDIVPALIAGGGPAPPAADAPSRLGHAFARVPLFYGFAYPMLAAAGFVLVRRSGDHPASRVLLAYTLAFGGLLLLRAFGGGLFRDLKELTFAAPLMALLTAVALDELAARGTAGRRAAVLVLAGLVAFGLGRYLSYLEAYASPFLVVTGAG